MNVNKNGKKIGLLILVIFSLSLVLNTNNVSAGWNWVEWDGYVYNDWGYVQANVTVRLKYGSTTLDTDVTISSGYYFIRAYIDNSKRYTLKASKANWTSQQYDNLIGRPEGSGPWRYYFNLDYVVTWAVVVGIRLYANFEPEAFSDNDADAWNTQLTNETGLDFDHVTVLKNSAATRSAINTSLSLMVSGADGGDILAFIFSGKGYSNETNWSLSAYDAVEEGEDGYLFDTELATIMKDSIAERVFFFFDCCNASGMRYELAELDNSETFFLSAATYDGQPSFDHVEEEFRCWTQCFLNYAWNGEVYEGSITADFFDICGTALSGYIYYDIMEFANYDYSKQQPQRYNYYGEGFCLSKEGISPQ